MAAPWYGSTKDGWLCDSIRSAASQPSPRSTTPAFSPGPTTTQGAVVGNRPRKAREDLYEQCSDHITEYMASSASVGGRSKISHTSAYSSSVIPSAWWIGNVSDM